VLRVTGATGGDDGNPDSFANGGREFAVESGAGAVGVHGGEEDFARATGFGLAGPFNGAAACRLAASADEDFSGIGWGAGVSSAGVDSDNDSLGSESHPDFSDEFRTCEGCGVDADLVRAGVENGGSFIGGADAAADSERDEELLGRALYGVEQRAAAFVGRRDVEEDDFVGSRCSVAGREFCGIAGIDEVDELHSFDDAASAHVEAGDDALGQHGFHSRKLRRT